MKFQAILIALIIIVSVSFSGATLSESEHLEKPAAETEKSFIKEIAAAISQKASGVAMETGNFAAEAFKASGEIGKKAADSGKNSVAGTISFFEELGAKTAESQELKIEKESEARDYANAFLPSRTKVDYPAISCDTKSFEIKSKAALIKYMDYNYNRDVFSKNAEERWPIASVSKLMTAVAALETMGWDEKISISEKAVSTEGIAGSLNAGEIYSVRDLIKAMLVTSSNDAAVALSEAFGEKEFIDAMQKRARELNMLQTTYLEPTGLSFVNQSTAADLSKLVDYIYQNQPELFKISRMKQAQIIDLKSGKAKTLDNINSFAGQVDFLGGKTGYIEESGRNLVALFDVDGRKVLTVTLGSDDSFAETDKLKSIVQSCK
jgi:D-alanyl-D-alanine carboxypeptidase